MRVVRTAALLTAALAGLGAAQAQGPIVYSGKSVQPGGPSIGRGPSAPIASQTLAPGEILLELSSLGMGQARPDRATLTVSIRNDAGTEAAAQSAHDALLRRVREATRAAGVAEADIESQGSSALMVFDVDEPPPTEVEPTVDVPVASPDPARQRPFKYSSLQVTLRQLDRLEGLQAALRDVAGVTVNQPNYAVADDASARRAARADALAKARADADTYAAALNLRVLRIARITERSGADFMSMMFGAMVGGGGADGMRERFEPMNGRVPVPVFVGVDFILAPR